MHISNVSNEWDDWVITQVCKFSTVSRITVIIHKANIFLDDGPVDQIVILYEFTIRPSANLGVQLTISISLFLGFVGPLVDSYTVYLEQFCGSRCDIAVLDGRLGARR